VLKINMDSTTTAMVDNMRAPRKARAILNRLVQSRQLTESGLNWLVEITDPMHDSEIRTVGYPDLTTTRTLTQCFTYTVNVSAPGLTGTSTWDCHTLFCPITPAGNGIQQLTPYQCTAATNVLSSAGSGSNLVSGWNVISGINGMDIFSTTGTSMTTSGSLIMPATAVSGEYRLIASSLEVVNTTPELYRGGSVTSWRSPNLKPQNSYCYLSAATTTLPTTIVCGNAPATNQANAQLFPASRTWGADQGVYQIISMTDIENPMVMAGVTPPPLFVQAPSNAQVVANSNVPSWGWSGGISGTGGVQLNNAGQLTASIVPFNWQGAMFVGLNANSTLQITARYIIERAPSVSEPQFLVLAQPPSDYDPTALEIYTRVVTELPVGVPVGENPLGEWFNDVLEAVEEYAPKVGAMFGPAGSFIGKGLGVGARMMIGERGGQSGSTMGNNKKKKKKKNPQPNQNRSLASKSANPAMAKAIANVMAKQKKRARRKKKKA